MKTLLLYTTLGCHLCEDAKLLIWPLLEKFNYRLQEIDIADSDELMQSYGTSIPVVKCSDDGEELNWPFDAVQLASLLAD